MSHQFPTRAQSHNLEELSERFLNQLKGDGG